MATVFISHSSADDLLAEDMTNWLGPQGFADYFVDHLSIEGGERWDDALRAALGSCRIVLCLITERWLASDVCVGEFDSAWLRGKRILPLIAAVEPSRLDETQRARWGRVRREDQGIEIGSLLADGRLDFTRDEKLAGRIRDALRASGASTRVGLDPTSFEIDRSAEPSPFPGLASFNDTDANAAIFFGRSRETAEVLERLRAARATGERRPLMILGASGSGKSSLLKAGVLPRLRREAPAWIALRAFRPGADPLFNFAEALARTSAERERREAAGAIRRRLFAAWEAMARDAKGEPTEAGWKAVREALDAEGAALRDAYARPQATLLISVDQAEELARADSREGEALADFLRATLQPGGAVDWALAFTIRTDSFPELQRHPRFRDLESFGYDLRTLPVFRFNDVVEAPARRYGVEIDPDLIEALMRDAPEQDALPLLAFALQRLWRRYGDAGRIREADYRAERGLSGLVEDAAERALHGLEPGQDKPLPKTPPQRRVLELAERAFVPPLVQVNDEAQAIRRVAAWSEFDAEARTLLERFGEWRLLVRKSGEAGETVEVAHEALFREWPRLKAWLEPERERLDTLRSVEVAAARWDRQGRKAADLAHFGQRLSEARELTRLERFAARLGETEHAYIAASVRAERRGRSRRRALQSTAMLLGFGVVGSSLWVGYEPELRREWLRFTAFQPLSAAAVAALQPGASFRECSDGATCPEMVVLPAGAFLMGSPEGVGDPDERPQHEVTIPAPFAVAHFEVTHAQWEACVAATRQPAEPGFGCAPVSDSGFGFANRPVINVGWHEAKGYIAWLNYMTSGDGDGPYRLLSEAEWEYAARGVTSVDAPSTAYYWGDDPEAREVCKFANVLNGDTLRHYPGIRGEPATCEDKSTVTTAEVGSFAANAFGLHDISGNVWEWVEDCELYPYTAEPRTSEPITRAGCDTAVVRGGSWGDDPQFLRSAYRLSYRRTDRGNYLGFRVARTFAD